MLIEVRLERIGILRERRRKLARNLSYRSHDNTPPVTTPLSITRPVVLPYAVDTVAPDGSEIRLLSSGATMSMVHCTLPPGRISLAVSHRTVEEVWYFLDGEGEVWRMVDGAERVDAVRPGVSLAIPTGAHFQFRVGGSKPLQILITTSPPWPGEGEAFRVADHWPI